MRRTALVATAAISLAGIWAAAANSETNSTKQITPHTHSPPPRHCTIAGFRPFSASVWRLGAWKRGRPPAKVLRARTAAYACAALAHRRAMKRTWQRDARRYFAHRKSMLWIVKYKPYVYPDGKRWAAPYPIAWCESGGHYYANDQGPLPSGAYGEIPPYPQYQPAKVQDEVAYQLMQEGKEYSAWVEWEGGCVYR